jgi:hypothetical protein
VPSEGFHRWIEIIIDRQQDDRGILGYRDASHLQRPGEGLGIARAERPPRQPRNRGACHLEFSNTVRLSEEPRLPTSVLNGSHSAERLTSSQLR